MIRVCIISIVFVFTTRIICQTCDYYYEYTGPAGDSNSYIIYTQQQDLFQIDFCTRNVPDRLTIYTNHQRTDSITFYIGTDIPLSDLSKKGYYKGYAEFDYNETYEDSLFIRKTQGVQPTGFSCFPSGVGGTMRLYFRTPSNVCALICKVEGNKDINTIYSLCIRKLEDGFRGRVDTFYIPVCERKSNKIEITNCIGRYYIYPDSSIKVKFDTKVPTCEDSYDGYIKTNIESFYNLGIGDYPIHFENSVCEFDTLISLGFSPFCRVYIPNTIKYSSLDYTNSFFTIFTAISVPYTLCIFDRWGNLLHQSDQITNYKGWDGCIDGEMLEGVFVYKIDFKEYNKSFSGDLTILK